MSSEAESGASSPGMCLTRDMLDSAVGVQSSPGLPRAAVALCLFTALTYIGMVLVDSEYVARYGASTVSRAVVLGVLVFLQMTAVMVTAYFPYGVLAVVSVVDLIILTISDRSGLGSIAVVVVIWYLVRYRIRHWMSALVGCVAVFILVFMAGEIYSGQRGIIADAILAMTELVQRYFLAVVVAEYMLGRERLHRALCDKAELLEREKQLLEQQERGRVERELRASRDALARDLHDIAGHHLSGVIVSAQAAAALRHKDPDRSDQMLRAVRDSAQTALADLRQIVGLLRSGDSSGSQREGQVEGGRLGEPTSSDAGPTLESAAVTGARVTREPVHLPSLAAVPRLVEESRRRQQRVGYAVNGRPCPLSPLADTAAYRMVQESLANSARHAPGAPCQVYVTYQDKCVEVVVSNRRPPNAEMRQADSGGKGGGCGGYGLSGMAERAALVGAELITGPDPDGGWCNRLVIPVSVVGTDRRDDGDSKRGDS